MITATTLKKTVSRAVKGSASWKALPRACSSVTPVKDVASDYDGQADQAHRRQMQSQT